MARASEVWDELDDRVFCRRYPALVLNVGVVVGEESVLVVDSRANHVEADELRRELRMLTDLPVRWVVNTHFHWDHAWGNARFPEAVLIGHRRCREVMVERGEDHRAVLLGGDSVSEAAKARLREVVIVPPELTFDDGVVLRVGVRDVAIRFLGRGHTDSDVVVLAGGVCFAGDLVEESGPPSFEDAFPVAWVETLDRLCELLPATVVPGHGGVVDPGYVREQRSRIAVLVAMARGDLPPSASPYPEDPTRKAVDRARRELGSTR